MTDPIQKTTEILTKHLGEKNNRGQIRLSEKHDELKNELHQLITKLCKDYKFSYQVKGINEAVEAMTVASKEVKQDISEEMLDEYGF